MRYISSQKLKELKKELDEYKEKRKEISKKVHEAQERGDISESAEYAEAKEAQAFNEGKIKELEQIISEAVVVSKKKNSGKVDIGSTVVVKNKDGRKEFTIVGSEEADPAQGKISNESPLGRAFLDKKKREEVKIHTPKGNVTYKILNIK